MNRKRMSLYEALETVCTVHPCAPNPGFIRQLLSYQCHLGLEEKPPEASPASPEVSSSAPVFIPRPTFRSS
jgi:hypothetical protein